MKGRRIVEDIIGCDKVCESTLRLEDIVYDNFKESFAPLIQLLWVSLLCDELSF